MNDITFWMNIENERRLQEMNRIREMEVADSYAKLAARNKFNDDLAAAKTGAMDTGRKYFERSGYPVDDALIQEIIDSITRSVPDLDSNPASYYNNDAFAGGINEFQSQGRTKYTNELNSKFTPGFEKLMMPDNVTDSIVRSILQDQNRSAHQILDFNRARGLLNDTGYGAARTALQGQKSAARSTLNSLANSVLGVDRQELLDIYGDAGSAASGWTFGSAAPDINSYYGQAEKQARNNLKDLEGSIRGSIGSTNYFDVPTALSKGGTMQGPINLTTQPSEFTPQRRRGDSGRGLGGGGIF